MWAFPLIGAFLGLIAGSFGWVALQVLPSIVVGALVLALLLWMTGLHHTDGLLDFGDGIMVHGNAEKKIAVMHDQLTGAGAIGLCVMTYLISAFAFSELNTTVNVGSMEVPLIFPGLIVIELGAKLSMVVAAWAGKSVHEGMNTSFLAHMHGRDGNLRLIAGIGISFLIAVTLLWIVGVFVVIAAVVSGLVMVLISYKHLKGVTGDVFGATNELSRMICVLVLLAVVAW
jgi:adenosylcobinamide-GDP ribazoletransferase